MDRRRALSGTVCLGVGLLVTAAGFAPQIHAQELAGKALVDALRNGGYSIYFRHAETDWGQGDDVDAAGDWTSCDPDEMRQLSDAGRATAGKLGEAIRALGVPVTEVLSSPYCRAAETARLMRIGSVETTRAIMNTRAAEYLGGREAVARRARRILSQPPPGAGNRVIVAHGNLALAAAGVRPSEGGSLVFAPRPERESGFELVARLSAQDWLRLANELAEPAAE